MSYQGDLLSYVQSLVTLQKRVYSTSRGIEYKGPCPLCGGRDRFWVHPNQVDGRWYCRQCEPKGGDFISLIMKVENLGYREALIRAGKEYRGKQKVKHMTTSQEKRYDKECDTEKWQNAVTKYIARSRDYLFEKKPDVLKWLHEVRGIDPILAQKTFIGISPKDFIYEGINFRSGLVIPYLYDGKIYGVKVRRPEGSNPRYINIKGGRSMIYRAYCVPNLPKDLDESNVILVLESELDALMVESVLERVLYDLVGTQDEVMKTKKRLWLGTITPVALGGSQSPNQNWRTLCRRTTTQLIATDNDTAGEEMARKFNKTRLRPTEKDPGEMWRKGGDTAIIDWLLSGMQAE